MDEVIIIFFHREVGHFERSSAFWRWHFRRHRSLYENTLRLLRARSMVAEIGNCPPRGLSIDTQSLRLKITWERHAFIYVASIPNHYTWRGYVTATSLRHTKIAKCLLFLDIVLFSHVAIYGMDGINEGQSGKVSRIIRFCVL